MLAPLASLSDHGSLWSGTNWDTGFPHCGLCGLSNNLERIQFESLVLDPTLWFFSSNFPLTVSCSWRFSAPRSHAGAQCWNPSLTQPNSFGVLLEAQHLKGMSPAPASFCWSYHLFFFLISFSNPPCFPRPFSVGSNLASSVFWWRDPKWMEIRWV